MKKDQGRTKFWMALVKQLIQHRNKPAFKVSADKTEHQILISTLGLQWAVMNTCSAKGGCGWLVDLFVCLTPGPTYLKCSNSSVYMLSLVEIFLLSCGTGKGRPNPRNWNERSSWKEMNVFYLLCEERNVTDFLHQYSLQLDVLEGSEDLACAWCHDIGCPASKKIYWSTFLTFCLE